MCTSLDLMIMAAETRMLAAQNDASEVTPAHQGMAEIWRETAEAIEGLAQDLQVAGG